MSLSLNPNVEINGPHFVYVFLNPSNYSNYNIIIKFVFYVKNGGSSISDSNTVNLSATRIANCYAVSVICLMLR